MIHQRKSLSLILVKQTQNFADNSYLFVNGKEGFKFKDNNNNVNFPNKSFFGSISKGRSLATESREVCSNGNVYDFSVDYNSIDKSHIFNIHKYLMTKNNVK